MKKFLGKIILFILGIGLLSVGGLIIWASTLTIPNLQSLQQEKVAESTKIYDRTGDVLLYNLHKNIHRTIIPSGEISKNIKNATVAIEDKNFYQHFGVSPTDIIRATIVDLTSLGFEQGGSTITQQVIKNALLTSKKSISRKLKEWILAVKLDRRLSKEEILTAYLNRVPYGGNIYGIEEASHRFFNKPASELSVAESAYLAALPKAPTYYSPYNNHREELETRKNLVLKKMFKLGFISKKKYKKAKKEEVEFQPLGDRNIKSPHFVMYIKNYLEKKYGKEAVSQGGFKVKTTLDYKLQRKVQKIVRKRALNNAKKFNARNAGAVVIDPQTGQILAMVGSRNYFSKKIPGNFNTTLALRQPGSTFKPFVYATALKKGYTPKTVVFDVRTQFSTQCRPTNFTSKEDCYPPVNYDGKFRGPVTFREALAQSINVPSVKVLYLTGIKDSINTARNMGIKNLSSKGQYGLTLVLGGGEVKLLNLTSAYGVFANKGVRNEPVGIIQIKNKKGKIVEEYHKDPVRVLSREISLKMSDILSDNKARAPAFGLDSPLYFEKYDVAAKTGTTDNYKDAWTVGYSPNIAVGVWVGNNNNNPMKNKVAGYIVAPMWHKIMKEALKTRPKEEFEEPNYNYNKELKPILRGVWKGQESYYVDKISGKLATKYTPEKFKKERFIPNVHSILYWVNKENPRGLIHGADQNDPQFKRWEIPVKRWAKKHKIEESVPKKPSKKDDVHTLENKPRVEITSPNKKEKIDIDQKIKISTDIEWNFDPSKVDFYIDGKLLGTSEREPFVFSFIPSEINIKSGIHTIRVVAFDRVLNKNSATLKIELSDIQN